MQHYSGLSLLRHGLNHHEDWPRMWRSPVPKKSYDVIIIGGGGHGLGTAYYLAKEFGITNVAVVEKGWLGAAIPPVTPPSCAPTICGTRPQRCLNTQ